MKNLALISLLCVLFSCNSENPSVNNLHVDLREIHNISYDKYFESVNIHKLETSDSSLIQKAGKILVHINTLYVLDNKQNAILLFNLHGKFIRKIQNVGAGPGEYIMLQDMCINKDKEELNLLTVNTSKIIIHDLQGNYLREHHLPAEIKAPKYFEAVDRDNYLIFSHYSDYQVKLYSIKQKKILSGYLGPIDQDVHENSFLKVTRSPFFYNGDTLKYFQAFTNDIYTFIEGKLILSHSWDFGDYNFNYLSDLPNDKSKYQDFIRSNSDKYVFYFYLNLENSIIHYTTILFDDKILNVIFNKQTNKYDIFNRFEEGYIPPTFILENNTLYNLISPISFDVFDNSDFFYQNELHKMDISANPVLFEFQLKQDFQ